MNTRNLIGLTLGLLGCVALCDCVIPMPVGDGRGDAGESDSDGTGTSGDVTASATGPSATDGSGSGGLGSDGSGSDGSGSDAGGSETSGGSATTGLPGLCEDNPDFQCSEPFDCSAWNCGEDFSQFDADGCLRRACTGPDDCGADETCFFPFDFGGCASSGIACYEAEGACECVGTPDCGGGYCMPEGQVPSAQCLGQPDEGACSAAGCNYFQTTIVITDACECLTDQPICAWFPNDEKGGATAPNFFWHEDTQTVAMFGKDWFTLPAGWRPCSDPGAPPACECYEPHNDPMCP
ncbi:MAG: hypothetical protein AAGF11_19445 [Myxococcota bacterium]